jgi:hypothetical protein
VPIAAEEDLEATLKLEAEKLEQTQRAAQPAEPAYLRNVPDLVGDLTEWICETARYPNRGLALGVALTDVGGLVGRRIAGPTGSGTALYILGLGPTGVGKQPGLDCGKAVLVDAGLEALIGPGAFESVQAVELLLTSEKPMRICWMDEFGELLERLHAVSPIASALKASPVGEAAGPSH